MNMAPLDRLRPHRGPSDGLFVNAPLPCPLSGLEVDPDELDLDERADYCDKKAHRMLRESNDHADDNQHWAQDHIYEGAGRSVGAESGVWVDAHGFIMRSVGARS